MQRKFNPLFILLLFLAGPAAAQSGPYGNEWINYSKTYYKIKVGSAGIHRVAWSAVTAAGMPSTVTGSQLQLFRDGQQVPLFVSAENLSGADFIEFAGRAADGLLDGELYGNTSNHANRRASLFTDTATYYLVADPAGTQFLRYSAVANNIPGAPPAPLAWCWATVGTNYKAEFSPGLSQVPDHSLQSSRFERGEGFVHALRDLYDGVPAPPEVVNLSTPGLALGTGENATIKTGVLTTSLLNNHELQFSVNNTLLATENFGPSDTRHLTASLPASSLNASNAFKYTYLNIQNKLDYAGIAYTEIRYPRTFSLGGLTTLSFALSGTGASPYLEFSGAPGSNGRLYDLTTGAVYTGSPAAGVIRFYVNGYQGTRDFIFVADNSAIVPSPVTAVQFKDYAAAANQGTFIIVSHKLLMQPVSGHDYVQDYADYRRSLTGGSYSVAVADVEELYDQYAYGYRHHPLAIRHFLKKAYNSWGVKPEYALLLGRGVLYSELAQYNASPAAYPFPDVPTYGYPGSDPSLANFNSLSKLSLRIGRVSAWNGADVGVYLQKLKATEAAYKSTSLPTTSSEYWKKQVLHIAGGSDASIQAGLIGTLNYGRGIIADTSTGAFVTTIAKSSTQTVNAVQSAFVDSLINNGLSHITFHGHASSTGFEFNLNDPETYHGAPRLPLLMALGCEVGQMFALNTVRTLAERYIFAPAGGSIVTLGQDNLGFTNWHTGYLGAFYTSEAKTNYGATLGRHFQSAFDYMMTGNDTGFTLTQLESMQYFGDPAMRLGNPPKPDYYVGVEGLAAIPSNVSAALDSFALRISSFNLGKATGDTVTVRVEHINPAGVSKTVRTYDISPLLNTDTATFYVTIDPIADLGLNKYRVTLDAPARVDEVSELNNSATLDVFIYSNDLVPVYPRAFSIVHAPGVVLKASTLNPFRPVGRYRMQIDTTEAFNSTLMRETSVTSSGGIIKWTPPVAMQDSTVYYWRAAFDSTVAGSLRWTGSSFIYLQNGSDGWNQSHFFQYKKDRFDDLVLNSERSFELGNYMNTLVVKNAVIDDNDDLEFTKIYYNGDYRQNVGHYFAGSIQVMVIDSLSGLIWENTASDTRGALPPHVFNGTSNYTRGTWVRDFPLHSAAYRQACARYIDSIPNGYFIVVRNAIFGPLESPFYVDDMKADTSGSWGSSGVSLYHSILNLGFPLIDSFNGSRAFVFARRKGRTDMPVFQEITGNGHYPAAPAITATFTLNGYAPKGQLRSTTVGPAKSWTSMHWKHITPDAYPKNDSPSLRIIGITAGGAETQLYEYLTRDSAASQTRDTSLSWISATAYPKLRLEWQAYDSVSRTSPQLKYWRVLYAPVPEAALNPAAHYAWSDSLQVGQEQRFETAIENLTPIAMDSMLVRYRVIDERGVAHPLADRRYRRLPGNDTLHATISFDPAAYPGKNFLYVEANPAEDQPEQYHPNNIGYNPFKIIVDNSNPLLDVTFDGVHILNGDLVSAKPFIKVRLKDENAFRALDDTALLRVSMRYPDDAMDSARAIPIDGTVCRFIPAEPGNAARNEATIEYRPEQLQDGRYTLIVTGVDKSGNRSGSGNRYQIEFEVDNKPAITKVLNYPNPFSTSTAFVFTITGYEIPQQFKIQIMTVTGKVVREITRAELGQLHIGRNITDYKWDGKDQYGQMLGNGVYLYRVVTTLNGKSMDAYNGARDLDGKTIASDRDGAGASVDKFFKGGWGKMYIMR